MSLEEEEEEDDTVNLMHLRVQSSDCTQKWSNR